MWLDDWRFGVNFINSNGMLYPTIHAFAAGQAFVVASRNYGTGRHRRDTADQHHAADHAVLELSQAGVCGELQRAGNKQPFQHVGDKLVVEMAGGVQRRQQFIYNHADQRPAIFLRHGIIVARRGIKTSNKMNGQLDQDVADLKAWRKMVDPRLDEIHKDVKTILAQMAGHLPCPAPGLCVEIKKDVDALKEERAGVMTIWKALTIVGSTVLGFGMLLAAAVEVIRFTMDRK